METALAATRFAHYAAAMFAFGVGFYLVAFAPPDLRAALSPWLRTGAHIAAAIALLSALVWLCLESASMNDDWSAAVDLQSLEDVLFSTAFGKVWQGRIALGILTILAFVFTRPERWGIPTLLAAVLLASLSLVDHGAMQSGGVGVAHRMNDAVHLLTAGGWLGGLAPFLMCLAAARSQRRAEEANVAMLRFSAVGHFAVIAIFLTGAVNICLTTHALPWPPSSPYRALLTAKIGVVAAMILLALINRYVLLPKVEAEARGARLLAAFACGELALGLVAVALVSYFGLLDPA